MQPVQKDAFNGIVHPPAQERLHKKLDALQAKAAAAPARKPTIDSTPELAAAREALAAREAEAAELRAELAVAKQAVLAALPAEMQGVGMHPAAELPALCVAADDAAGSEQAAQGAAAASCPVPPAEAAVQAEQ